MLTSHAVFLAAPVDRALSSPEREVNAACFTAAFGSMLLSRLVGLVRVPGTCLQRQTCTCPCLLRIRRSCLLNTDCFAVLVDQVQAGPLHQP
jgi:hypothetical protein